MARLLFCLQLAAMPDVRAARVSLKPDSLVDVVQRRNCERNGAASGPNIGCKNSDHGDQ